MKTAIKPTPKQVLKAVLEVVGEGCVQIPELYSRAKRTRLTNCRRIAAYLLRDQLMMSFQEINLIIRGKRNGHSSAFEMYTNAVRELQRDEELEALMFASWERALEIAARKVVAAS